MYTTIVVKHDTEGPFFDWARKRCDELMRPGNGASHAACGMNGPYVNYDLEGIAIRFGTRILRLPSTSMSGNVVSVRIDDSRAVRALGSREDKKWRRERSWAALAWASDTAYITVIGRSLLAANHLYDDIIKELKQAEG
jgi:hypothetical protein